MKLVETGSEEDRKTANIGLDEVVVVVVVEEEEEEEDLDIFFLHILLSGFNRRN